MARPSTHRDTSWLRATIVWVLTRTRGEARALTDARQLEHNVRLGLSLTALLLLPAVLLAVLALTSIRSGELSLDADLRVRADASEQRVRAEAESQFTAFQVRLTERFTRGESPLHTLSDLSPWLRAAFRFDNSGQLAAPFDLPDPAERPEPTTAWRMNMARGVQAEQRGALDEALIAFRSAVAGTPAIAHQAEARYAVARILDKQGRYEESNTALSDLYADAATVRIAEGVHRVGDLVMLLRGESALRRSPDIGRTALAGFVEELLNERWTMGSPSEAAIARRALDQLDGGADPDWVARMRTRLTERTEQLRWASAVTAELDLATGVPLPAEGAITWYAPPSSPAIWGVTTHRGERYAFVFARDAVVEHLSRLAAQTDALEPDLTIQLTSGSPRAGVLAARSLEPYVPFLVVTVSAADPDALEATKTSRRILRAAVVLTSLFLIGVGVFFAARTIAAEVEAARQKADFAANVSHELRSPINQIRLKGEVLQQGLVRDEADRQAHVDAIVREAERLSRLVDDVLDFAAIERGTRTYQLRPEDLNGVVYFAVEAMQPELARHQLKLVMELPEDGPEVALDGDAIRQVIVNLVSNAIKYGSEGGEVRVSVTASDTEAVVAVADRGRGIAAADLPRLFDHFFRSDDPAVRKKKGTGIGLSIVRYIVESHGGSIRAESRVGQGAVFIVTLPLASQQPD